MKTPVTSLLMIATLFCGCSSDNSSRDQADHAQPPTPAVIETSSEPREDLGEYVSFPTCGIKIRCPIGFQTTTNFDGFGEVETHATITVVGLPSSFSKTSSGFTEAEMKKRGWSMLSKNDVRVDGLRGVVCHFEQPNSDRVYVKWSLVFGNDDKTTLVTATIPKAHERELSAKLKSAVMSTRLEAATVPKSGDDLPFTLGASKKLLPTTGLNKTLLYTKDGLIPTKSPSDPLLIVAPGLTPVIGNKQEFAEKLLNDTAQTKQIMLKSTNVVRIDDLDGLEFVAEAKDSVTDTPLNVYQVILFNDESYIRIVGIAGADVRETYLPEFKKMAQSLRRKKP